MVALAPAGCAEGRSAASPRPPVQSDCASFDHNILWWCSLEIFVDSVLCQSTEHQDVMIVAVDLVQDQALPELVGALIVC